MFYQPAQNALDELRKFKGYRNEDLQTRVNALVEFINEAQEEGLTDGELYQYYYHFLSPAMRATNRLLADEITSDGFEEEMNSLVARSRSCIPSGEFQRMAELSVGLLTLLGTVTLAGFLLSLFLANKLESTPFLALSLVLFVAILFECIIGCSCILALTLFKELVQGNTPAVLSTHRGRNAFFTHFKEVYEEKNKPQLTTKILARQFFLASISDPNECPMAMLPEEMLAYINGFVVGKYDKSIQDLFMNHFGRPQVQLSIEEVDEHNEEVGYSLV